MGEPYSDEELAALYKEGEDRFAAQVPPGFRDAKKSVPERYGDLILWKQIISIAKERSVPVVLVTNDTKEDWVWTFKGRDIGPRPELVQEIHKIAQQNFYLYNAASFVLAASKFLKTDATPAVVSEAERIKEADRVAAADETIALEPPGFMWEQARESFPFSLAAEVADVTNRQLDNWVHTGLIVPSYITVAGPRFSLDDIVKVATARKLLDEAVSLQRIREFMNTLHAGDLTVPTNVAVAVAEDAIFFIEEASSWGPQTPIKSAILLRPLISSVIARISRAYRQVPDPK